MDVGPPRGWGAGSAAAGGGPTSPVDMAASPVTSLRSAMEAKWMSGGLKAIPRAISKAMNVPLRNKRQLPVTPDTFH